MSVQIPSPEQRGTALHRLPQFAPRHLDSAELVNAITDNAQAIRRIFADYQTLRRSADWDKLDASEQQELVQLWQNVMAWAPGIGTFLKRSGIL